MRREMAGASWPDRRPWRSRTKNCTGSRSMSCRSSAWYCSTGMGRRRTGTVIRRRTEGSSDQCAEGPAWTDRRWEDRRRVRPRQCNRPARHAAIPALRAAGSARGAAPKTGRGRRVFRQVHARIASDSSTARADAGTLLVRCAALRVRRGSLAVPVPAYVGRRVAQGRGR